jgi:predicted XRE-type DNA-binding protein
MTTDVFEYVIPTRTYHNCKPILYKINDDGCWECVSRKLGSCGYIYIHHNDKQIRLHRYVFEKEVGPIVEGNVILHKCDNRKCFNPNHLQQGTQIENVLDMYQKGRSYDKSGSNNPRSKLSNKDVYEIKHLLSYTKITQREIAQLYGVDHTQISMIFRNKRFTNITL